MGRRDLKLRIPEDLAVEMGVHVDESRSHGETVSIDYLLGIAFKVSTNRRDLPVLHGDVGHDRNHTGSIHDGPSTNQQVEHRTPSMGIAPAQAPYPQIDGNGLPTAGQ